ncbi:cytochrome P450 [Natronobiforma cellulositropha]|uniref:cytochrome P450 n=1 Tax=Natronobiforma cellulositropha TaxID=1679076 RepID=UPI0021D5909D|nr:cytochrome P450 [Natronobiforma cellulositropha]
MNTHAPSPSGHPVLGHTLHYARDAFGLVDRAIDTVGDVARMEVLGVGDIYVLAHPEYAEQVLSSEVDAFRKNESFEVAFGESIIAAEGAQWENQRDLMQEFFYPERIRAYAEEMVTLTEARVARWEDGERISLREEMTAVALENLFGTLFDRRLDPDGDEALRRAANDLNAWFVPSSWVLPVWVPTPARRRFRRAVETLREEAHTLLEEREREGLGDDFLSALVASRGQEDGLTETEIVDQVIGFTFAGHDTTALTLTYALHSLGTNPAARERFHAELETVLDGASPTLADVGRLEVTERIVLEAMRLYPPVHTIPRAATRPVEVGGYRLPADEMIHLSAYRIHRDERFWDDPLAFRPERWCETSPQSAGYAYIPFGAGPRACLGRRFAMLEATLVLATVGSRYHLEPLAGLELAPEMTTQPGNAVPVRLHER